LPILVTLMMEEIRSSEMSVLIRAKRRNIPEDGILRCHRRQNLKSYVALTGWALYRRCNVFPVRYKQGFISQKTAFFIITAVITSHLKKNCFSTKVQQARALCGCCTYTLIVPVL
jgi:hypothetical protein